MSENGTAAVAAVTELQATRSVLFSFLDFLPPCLRARTHPHAHSRTHREYDGVVALQDALVPAMPLDTRAHEAQRGLGGRQSAHDHGQVRLEVADELHGHVAQQHAHVQPCAKPLVLQPRVLALVAELRALAIPGLLLQPPLRLQELDVLLCLALATLPTLATFVLVLDNQQKHTSTSVPTNNQKRRRKTQC